MRHLFSENIKQPLVDVLLAELRRATEARFAVAFVKHSGLALLEKELRIPNLFKNNSGRYCFPLVRQERSGGLT